MEVFITDGRGTRLGERTLWEGRMCTYASRNRQLQYRAACPSFSCECVALQSVFGIGIELHWHAERYSYDSALFGPGCLLVPVRQRL